MLTHIFKLALIVSAASAKIYGGGNSLPKEHLLGKSPTSVDMMCVTVHCPEQMAAALIDPTFYKMSVCEEGCNPFYYNDTSDMKLQY
jgi:hypothetical protein